MVDRAKTDSSGLASKATGANNLDNQFYIVQKGDTLYSIALNHGVDFKKLAEWNNIVDPKSIRPGQKLSLSASADDARPVLFALPQQPIETTIEPNEQPFLTVPEESENRVSSHVKANLKTNPKALKLPFSEQNAAQLRNPVNAASAAQVPLSSRPVEVAKNNRIEVAPQPELQKSADKAVNQSDTEWIWPTTGKLLSSFSKNSKGVKISGQAGQPVLASAAGEVVYSGHGLRGYGNLIIIKHNNTFLSAYAHNSKILVKEGEAVTKGQKIAEMGNTDTDTIQLHFEIRKHGKPVDPMEYLPNQS
ncbi:peptidoglycan DD-metalloendopeptidase family protein [Nitrosomonas sp. Nm84]|uniref:peptidoglycan DD-metalloendopeptidase family protein n=1 Tax=Nitrosomonas sp. Nm84 TaxID=200124 RepID=UPI0021AC2936|nr:peptidoglycan DD-metalloendopeptidase family protein [Nitrosomonas sp. Nm84]